MANLSLLVVILAGSLCVEVLAHKTAGEIKRDAKVLRDILTDELEKWRETETEKEELLEMEMRDGSGDDADDGSGAKVHLTLYRVAAPQAWD